MDSLPHRRYQLHEQVDRTSSPSFITRAMTKRGLTNIVQFSGLDSQNIKQESVPCILIRVGDLYAPNTKYKIQNTHAHNMEKRPLVETHVSRNPSHRKPRYLLLIAVLAKNNSYFETIPKRRARKTRTKTKKIHKKRTGDDDTSLREKKQQHNRNDRVLS